MYPPPPPPAPPPQMTRKPPGGFFWYIFAGYTGFFLVHSGAVLWYLAGGFLVHFADFLVQFGGFGVHSEGFFFLEHFGAFLWYIFWGVLVQLGGLCGALGGTGGTSPRFWYATPPPPPLPAVRANLVAKGQQLLGIHMVAPKAPEIFFFIPLAHFVHFAPQHYP